MRKTYLTIALLFVSTITSYGQTTYFLVADFDPNFRTDSYVLPLTAPNDIAHARDLIANGPGVGTPLVVADIVCGADGINRNFLSPSKNQWLWHITQFTGFADMTIEILDGSPTMVNNDCTWWMTNTGGKIGFWNHTVIAEIGENPKPWQGNLNTDQAVNFVDLNVLSQFWDNASCVSPSWCSGADMNHDHSVNLADLELFAQTWLTAYPGWPRWFSAWSCPRQCHGDADCQGTGIGSSKIWVNTADLAPLTALYGHLPVSCGNLYYNPSIDFDRDCDIDDDDITIIERWFMEPGVPADCPTQP